MEISLESFSKAFKLNVRTVKRYCSKYRCNNSFCEIVEYIKTNEGKAFLKICNVLYSYNGKGRWKE